MWNDGSSLEPRRSHDRQAGRNSFQGFQGAASLSSYGSPIVHTRPSGMVPARQRSLAPIHQRSFYPSANLILLKLLLQPSDQVCNP